MAACNLPGVVCVIALTALSTPDEASPLENDFSLADELVDVSQFTPAVLTDTEASTLFTRGRYGGDSEAALADADFNCHGFTDCFRKMRSCMPAKRSSSGSKQQHPLSVVAPTQSPLELKIQSLAKNGASTNPRNASKSQESSNRMSYGIKFDRKTSKQEVTPQLLPSQLLAVPQNRSISLLPKEPSVSTSSLARPLQIQKPNTTQQTRKIAKASRRVRPNRNVSVGLPSHGAFMPNSVGHAGSVSGTSPSEAQASITSSRRPLAHLGPGCVVSTHRISESIFPPAIPARSSTASSSRSSLYSKPLIVNPTGSIAIVGKPRRSDSFGNISQPLMNAAAQPSISPASGGAPPISSYDNFPCIGDSFGGVRYYNTEAYQPTMAELPGVLNKLEADMNGTSLTSSVDASAQNAKVAHTMSTNLLDYPLPPTVVSKFLADGKFAKSKRSAVPVASYATSGSAPVANFSLQPNIPMQPSVSNITLNPRAVPQLSRHNSPMSFRPHPGTNQTAASGFAPSSGTMWNSVTRQKHPQALVSRSSSTDSSYETAWTHPSAVQGQSDVANRFPKSANQCIDATATDPSYPNVSHFGADAQTTTHTPSTPLLHVSQLPKYNASAFSIPKPQRKSSRSELSSQVGRAESLKQQVADLRECAKSHDLAELDQRIDFMEKMHHERTMAMERLHRTTGKVAVQFPTAQSESPASVNSDLSDYDDLTFYGIPPGPGPFPRDYSSSTSRSPVQQYSSPTASSDLSSSGDFESFLPDKGVQWQQNSAYLPTSSPAWFSTRNPIQSEACRTTPTTAYRKHHQSTASRNRISSWSRHHT